MAEYIVTDNELTSIADAIRAKSGTSESLAFPNGFINVIDAIETSEGGSESRKDLTEPKDVDFIDFDGRLLYSYTASEFLALTELPPNPSYPGLTAQGWNWTLADAKEYVNDIGGLVIGQLYLPNDGATHISITIDTDCPVNNRNFSIAFKSSTSNNVTIDWDDGTIETVGSTSTTLYPHSYISSGDYDIKIIVNSGNIILNGDAAGGNPTAYGPLYYMGLSIKSIMFGNGISELGRYAFRNAYNLKMVTLPNYAISFNYSPFYETGLTCLVTPDNTQAIDNACFGSMHLAKYVSLSKTTSVLSGKGGNLWYGNSNIKKVYIPPAITYLTSGAIGTCYNLKKIIIPSWITIVGTLAFSQMTGCLEYHFQPTVPPTLSGTNAFSGIQTNAVIYVPYSADHSILEAYKTATNWSTYADKIQEEPQ